MSQFRRIPVIGLCLLLGACATHPPAPVVERSSRPPPAEIPVDGLYRVERGDTLYAIAFNYGLDHRDIARWNNIAAPYTIFPDQALRLRAPPPSSGSSRVSTSGVRSPAASTTTSTRTTASNPPPPKPAPEPAPARPAPSTSTSKPAASASSPPPSTASAGGWAWPLEGPVLRTFKAGDPLRKGIDISGAEGAPVLAAGSGEVVYSGNGLIGYGELVIVKHDERMLSAYAHNRRRLVAEGDRVTQGQTIAEVGRNDRSETVLHFEIRRDGKPVDPLQLLPAR